jgi:hypothetical protein
MTSERLLLVDAPIGIISITGSLRLQLSNGALVTQNRDYSVVPHGVRLSSVNTTVLLVKPVIPSLSLSLGYTH